MERVGIMVIETKKCNIWVGRNLDFRIYGEGGKGWVCIKS